MAGAPLPSRLTLNSDTGIAMYGVNNATGGNAIGVFDPKTERITEWKVPTPWSAPYDVVADRNGDAWTGSMLTDRVARLDIKSGQYTEYMLPRSTNIRRVYVDDSKSPGTLWIGSNHGASIVKLEPLD